MLVRVAVDMLDAMTVIVATVFTVLMRVGLVVLVTSSVSVVGTVEVRACGCSVVVCSIDAVLVVVDVKVFVDAVMWRKEEQKLVAEYRV